MSCGATFTSALQGVALRHDQHDRLARRDYAAHRMDGELMHNAIDRGADIDALKLVLGRDLRSMKGRRPAIPS